MDDSRLALFLMLGQSAERVLGEHPHLASSQPLMLSDSYDLSVAAPEVVRQATSAADAYRLFFVFENYLRELVVRALSKDGTESWWEKIPHGIQEEVKKLAETEEVKSWMALGSRDESLLMTYPQLLTVIDERWKEYFTDFLRDKALVQEARHVSHLRNTVCHMSPIPDEELQRVRQVMRDWFRVVAP